VWPAEWLKSELKEQGGGGAVPKSKTRVFLDANIVIGAGKPPGGPELARVADLVDAGLISVLTTDLTITEVVKKHVQNDFDLIRSICQPHFREIVKAATGAALPDIKNAQLKQQLEANYSASTKSMFKALKAKTLGIDNVKPTVVFAAYAAKQGFFSGEGKKDQFPDAFTFECLKLETSAKEPVIIVSDDGDFSVPVANEKHILLVKSLPDLFFKLGLKMEAPEVGAFLDEHNEELLSAVDSELSNWGLQGDVADSEIDETSVNAVGVNKITAFKPIAKGDPILVVGQLDVLALVSYTHPDWDNASYDSEDKVLIPFGDVSGETEVNLQVDFSMSLLVDDEGEPEQIDELRFSNDKFVYVELHPNDAYN